jgi:glycosyltransferase involved in cell wall biosynthesis
MTRVSIVLPSHWSMRQGGAEYQANILACELVKRGHEVSWLARLVPPAGKFQDYPIHEIVQRFNYKWTKPNFFFGAIQLTRKLEEIKPDVIYQRVGCAYTGITARYAKQSGCGMVWHVARDDEVTPVRLGKLLKNPFRFFEKNFLEYGVRNAKKIIIQTPAQGELLDRYYGRTDGILIPNFHPVPEVIPPKQTPYKVVWVANFKKVKRPDLYLDLVSRFANSTDVQFVMIGAAPDSKTAWQQNLAARIKEIPNLQYLGKLPQEEVNKKLAEAHVLVNTSAFEGLPNTFIQAWMRKLVVLSLSVNPGNFLDDSSLGGCAEGDLDALEARLRAYLDQPEKLQADGEYASQFACKTFSEANLNKLVEEVLASAQPSPSKT